MDLLIDGVWRDQWYDTASTGGHFVRSEAVFRDWITDEGPFKPEPDRYHLYVANACPWAHRAVLFRKLKGLEHIVGLSIVDPYMGENGWFFSEAPGCIPDTVNGCEYLYELYIKADSGFTGRVTTPTLWDRKQQTIVSNESADIIRMFNSAFDRLAEQPEPDFYPEALRESIDAINAPIYDEVNNGVYKSGFATTQAAYEKACRASFFRLDELEALLSKQRYLVRGQLTEADWRLFTTLIRFDAVYVGHFKCNLRRICDYPALHGYMRELYQYPGVADTVVMEHIKAHYYRSHGNINPTGIVPIGPELSLDEPHGRASLPI